MITLNKPRFLVYIKEEDGYKTATVGNSSIGVSDNMSVSDARLIEIVQKEIDNKIIKFVTRLKHLPNNFDRLDDVTLYNSLLEMGPCNAILTVSDAAWKKITDIIDREYNKVILVDGKEVPATPAFLDTLGIRVYYSNYDELEKIVISRIEDNRYIIYSPYEDGSYKPFPYLDGINPADPLIFTAEEVLTIIDARCYSAPIYQAYQRKTGICGLDIKELYALYENTRHQFCMLFGTNSDIERRVLAPHEQCMVYLAKLEKSKD